MHLGCHAVLFKDMIKTETESTISNLAKTGFEGAEIGFRFFGTEDKKTLEAILDKNKFQMSGMHVGSELAHWADPLKVETVKARVMAVAEFVKDMPNRNIIMSGIDQEGVTDLMVMAQNINEAAKACADIGVTLNYHNHNWEFADKARVMQALISWAPDLKFGFDLGWVQKSGYDPVTLIKENAERIQYLHLRDMDEEGNFVNIGEGCVDFGSLMPLVKEILGEDGWAIIEYEQGPEDFDRYSRANTYLKKFI